MESKVCVCCGVEKLYLDFYRYQKNDDGFMARCKECHKESKRKSRIKHKDRERMTNKIYRENNKEKIKEYFKKSYIPKPKRIQYEWPPPTDKQCSCCGLIKSINDFVKSSKTKHGIGSQCLDCVAHNSRIRRMNPEEKIKNKNYSRQYRYENKDSIKLSYNKYYTNHKNEYSRRRKLWAKHNREYMKIKAKEYVELNRALYNSYTHARRARKKNATHIHHNKQIELVYHEMASRVKKCLKFEFQVDHILPLNSGGYHHHQNLQVITGKLNGSKKDNINFKHPSIIHWTDLPDFLIDNVKLKSDREQSLE